jgi:hypothetical protein
MWSDAERASKSKDPNFPLFAVVVKNSVSISSQIELGKLNKCGTGPQLLLSSRRI